jgi:hypothetical protein
MHAKVLSAAILVSSLSLLGCDQQSSSPGSSVSGEDMQAAAPAQPNQALENQPPAAGTVSPDPMPAASEAVPAPTEPAASEPPATSEALPATPEPLPADGQTGEPVAPN